ncbi:MAG: hypothetical protein HOM21_05305, partial [Halobacteriovoraceae bacterium]|nr:hypothetical protein [Halobacteriovoraceae bacterium]
MMTSLRIPFTTILFGLLLTLTSACGYKAAKQKKGVVTFGSTLPTVAVDLTEEEMEIALRVCYALKQKRLNFTTSRMGNPFNFHVQVVGCEGNIIANSDAATTLEEANDILVYQQNPAVGADTPGPETDEGNAFSPICGELLSGGKAKNLHQPSVLIRQLYTFQKSGLEDVMVINWGRADQHQYARDEFEMYRYDTYRIFTSNGSDPNLGLILD